MYIYMYTNKPVLANTMHVTHRSGSAQKTSTTLLLFHASAAARWLFPVDLLYCGSPDAWVFYTRDPRTAWVDYNGLPLESRNKRRSGRIMATGLSKRIRQVYRNSAWHRSSFRRRFIAYEHHICTSTSTFLFFFFLCILHFPIDLISWFADTPCTMQGDVAPFTWCMIPDAWRLMPRGRIPSRTQFTMQIVVRSYARCRIERPMCEYEWWRSDKLQSN